jgi:asparagine synthase (glutamine-hydrolysing)
MCGIAGVAGPGDLPLAALSGVADRLRHRGPDGEGFAVVEGEVLCKLDRAELLGRPATAARAALAHRRLTILDLTDRAAQPMLAPGSRVAITYNGEIYNFVELRDELLARGHPVESTGDTEVLLHAYLEWGPDCVSRLVGMWAFAVVDLDRDILFLSRDRFGIKPLYYARLPEKNGLAFASELKGLRGIEGLPWEPDPAVAKRFLLSGVSEESAATFFQGIRQVEPATSLLMSLREGAPSLSTTRYWEPAAQPGAATPADASTVRETLEEAVRVHLRSDVAIGTCLSGGIDSTGLVALCDRLRRRGTIPQYTHHAFGYVPPSGEYSEESFMRDAADHSGVELEIVRPSPQEFDTALLDIVRQQDEPFGSLSIAAQYFVFRMASARGIKVMLDGQGADEVFGGYHSYLSAKGFQLLRRRRTIAYLRYAMAHQRAYGRPPVPWYDVARAGLRRVLRADATVRPAGEGPQLLSGDLLAARPSLPPPPDTLHGLLVFQTTAEKLPSLLRFEDRNSMAHSVEGRVPYLDHRLVDVAFALPEERKIDGVTPKAVLRAALSDVLPSSVLARRDKVGFRADSDATYRFVRRHAAALLEARTPWEEDWFDRVGVGSLLASPDRSESGEFFLWRLINLKLWLRLTFAPERDPVEPAGVGTPV